MFRFILIAIVTILGITFLRSIIGLITKVVSQAVNADPPQPDKKVAVPTGGSLRKDPVCGTYVAELGALQLTVKGEPVYFCSAACRDKFSV